MWPQATEPRFAGYTAWRLITSPPEPLIAGARPGGVARGIGLPPLADRRIYLFAVCQCL
jgi:hypothetical protein